MEENPIIRRFFSLKIAGCYLDRCLHDLGTGMHIYCALVNTFVVRKY